MPICFHRGRRFIKGCARGKLTGCEKDFAINLPGCFRLLFLLSLIRKTKNARLKNPTDLLHIKLTKPLHRMGYFKDFSEILLKSIFSCYFFISLIAKKSKQEIS